MAVAASPQIVKYGGHDDSRFLACTGATTSTALANSREADAPTMAIQHYSDHGSLEKMSTDLASKKIEEFDLGNWLNDMKEHSRVLATAPLSITEIVQQANEEASKVWNGMFERQQKLLGALVTSEANMIATLSELPPSAHDMYWSRIEVCTEKREKSEDSFAKAQKKHVDEMHELMQTKISTGHTTEAAFREQVVGRMNEGIVLAEKCHTEAMKVAKEQFELETHLRQTAITAASNSWKEVQLKSLAVFDAAAKSHHKAEKLNMDRDAARSKLQAEEFDRNVESAFKAAIKQRDVVLKDNAVAKDNLKILAKQETNRKVQEQNELDLLFTKAKNAHEGQKMDEALSQTKNMNAAAKVLKDIQNEALKNEHAANTAKMNAETQKMQEEHAANIASLAAKTAAYQDQIEADIQAGQNKAANEAVMVEYKLACDHYDKRMSEALAEVKGKSYKLTFTEPKIETRGDRTRYVVKGSVSWSSQ